MKVLKLLLKQFTGSLILLFGGVFWVKLFLRKKTKLIVLNYHNFSLYNNFTVKRGSTLQTGYSKNFEEQIRFLNRHFSFLTPEKFFKDNAPKGTNVFITFDDGYKDNYDLAFPILKKMNIPTAFFIVTSLPNTNTWLLHDQLRFLASENKLKKDVVEKILQNLNRGVKINEDFLRGIDSELKHIPLHRLMMNWGEIKDLHNNGFIIGSHTHTHFPLKFLEEKLRVDELHTSTQILQSKLNTEVTHFAYPNGLYDEGCHSLMLKNKIEFAYTTQRGCNRPHDCPLKIKRIGVNASDSIGIIVLKIIINLIR